ncbi:hypothetical protein [Humibacter antri]
MSESNKLTGAFRRGLDLGDRVDVTTLQYRAIPEWDSIGHMALIAEIEGEYDVMFTTEQVIALSSYDRAIELLREHGVDEL